MTDEQKDNTPYIAPKRRDKFTLDPTSTTWMSDIKARDHMLRRGRTPGGSSTESTNRFNLTEEEVLERVKYILCMVCLRIEAEEAAEEEAREKAQQTEDEQPLQDAQEDASEHVLQEEEHKKPRKARRKKTT
ncbi:hypothetical protein [Ktedonobacter racemifer]|uniref:Uncharacterized protein n=1 Tax=Ktedonobacter racemifer DSM 44963 TaxID=485913 RepID=D6TN63_KTERA|nr:hypothetical protein [Ktedonobacter racemifer]EFH87213.1 hypothetical protein Krac_8542 [Ktedonobacter racemifer DSM 44963]